MTIEKEEKSHVAFSLPRPLAEKADRIAEREFISRAAWLRRLVAQRLQEIEV
jgi:hypothetical protein